MGGGASVPVPAPVTSALPPVVLLHGWGGSYESTWVASGWRERLRARGRQVIGIDLPGHGAAPDSADPAAYADLAALVRERLPRQGQVDVIGYSLGAKITLALAVREPGLVRRAVLCGLGGNAFAPETHGAALAALLEQGVDDETPAGLAALVAYGLAAGNSAHRLAAVLRRPPNPQLNPAQLRALRCPLLLVTGELDTVAQPLEPLLQALPGARQLTLAGVDHLTLPAQPALMAAALAFCSA
ncbi:MAG: alpha/beta fold hydrolase [Pseudomonadota bacterium]